MTELEQLQADLAEALAEYAELPESDEDSDRREAFVLFRIKPIRDKIKALVTTTAAESAAGDVVIYGKAPSERYQAPKLKGIEDILKCCAKNGAAVDPAALEGVGAR